MTLFGGHWTAQQALTRAAYQRHSPPGAWPAEAQTTRPTEREKGQAFLSARSCKARGAQVLSEHQF